MTSCNFNPGFRKRQPTIGAVITSGIKPVPVAEVMRQLEAAGKTPETKGWRMFCFAIYSPLRSGFTWAIFPHDLMKNTAKPLVAHAPECQPCIDAVLSTLAAHYSDAMDPLLDLKLDTARKTNPGTCVQTYFWLLNRLPESARGELHQIRLWLEGLIEVVAFKANKELFLRRALKLDVDSLETYCTGMIQHVRRMTAQTPLDLELGFAFRE